MSARHDADRIAEAKHELIELLTSYARLTGRPEVWECALLLAIFDLNDPRVVSAFNNLQVPS